MLSQFGAISIACFTLVSVLATSVQAKPIAIPNSPKMDRDGCLQLSKVLKQQQLNEADSLRNQGKYKASGAVYRNAIRSYTKRNKYCKRKHPKKTHIISV